MTLPRFYPILDTVALRRAGVPLIDAAEAVIEAGAGIVQVRHKGAVDRGTYEEMQRVSGMCREYSVIFVVNDRADMALLLGAALHLGQDDLPPLDARSLVGKETTIGFSTHNEDQLRMAYAEPVNYLALGPIFKTASKENPDPVVGVEELRRLRPLTGRPLVAIGGITRENAREVWRAGADAVAVVADLVPEQANKAEIRRRAEEWLELS